MRAASSRWLKNGSVKMLLTPSNLQYEEMRRIVLGYVLSDQNPPDQYSAIIDAVAKYLVDHGYCKETNSYYFPKQYLDISNEDANMVNEIVWDLIIERVLAIGLNKENPSWPFLRLTEYGKSLVKSGENVIIHDVDGMVELLRKSIPQCNRIIIAYFTECLETYRINSLLASSVMLGCAAEKLICELFDRYLLWLEKTYSKEYSKLKNAESRNIARKFDELTASIKSHKPDISDELLSDYDLTVNSIFTIIRKNRNDAGHPTGKTISREELRLMAYVFIEHCKKVYALIEYFDK